MRLSKKGRTVSMTFDFWLSDDQTIHIATNDPDPAAQNFHVNLTNTPGWPNSHLRLYRQLAECLRSKGAPAPDRD